MINYQAGPRRSDEHFPKRHELAWRIADVAADPVEASDAVTQMAINRVVDNAAVATAALTRDPVAAARAQAQDHPYRPGSTVFGIPGRYSPDWAAWANGVAVRELDFHDTFLAAEYAHPGDNIAPVIAVAQHAASRGLTGRDVIRGIATGYEIQIDLARAINLHDHKIDHVAHLGPSAAAAIGTLLRLSPDVIYQAIGQALHTTTATRQSRKGEISTWKAYAPAFAGKMAIEAVDRAIRGQTSPSPIWEGEDGVMSWLLDGPEASYEVSLPGPGEPKKAILDSFTKEHSAEYQAQAWIDLAHRLGRAHPKLRDPANVSSVLIRTSNHTHFVIGSGAGDPQKYDPMATRETLDHSLPYIFTVALQDGEWHHIRSYLPERARRPDTVALWRKVTTVEDPEWTLRYLCQDPKRQAFGGRVEITLSDGSTLAEEIAVADAHPLGVRPFGRSDYVHKFRTLADGILQPNEVERFLTTAARLPELGPAELAGLTVTAPTDYLADVDLPKGLF